MAGKANEDLLGIRIVGPNSLQLFESANFPSTPYVGSLELTRHFGGLTVDEMEAAGRMDEVLAAVERLITGAFS